MRSNLWARHALPVVLGLVVAAGWATWSEARERGPGNGPTPGHEEQDGRLLPAPGQGWQSQSYAFFDVQPDGRTPVTWSPCRPIHYVVRSQTMPAFGPKLLDEAFARLSAATGLVFVNDGDTDEVPRWDRPSYQPERYGDRWAPVLVVWSHEAELSGLQQAAGRAGPRAVRLPSGESVWVSGIVVLDVDDFSMNVRQDWYPIARTVVFHELGHLVGLDHTADAYQVMASGTYLNTDYQQGDLAGLAVVGSGPCRPEV